MERITDKITKVMYHLDAGYKSELCKWQMMKAAKRNTGFKLLAL
jgi:hypothetical protein